MEAGHRATLPRTRRWPGVANPANHSGEAATPLARKADKARRRAVLLVLGSRALPIRRGQRHGPTTPTHPQQGAVALTPAYAPSHMATRAAAEDTKLPNPETPADIIGMEGDKTATTTTTIITREQLPPWERRAPKGDPDNPSKGEAEAMAAIDAILPDDADERWTDEEQFEDIIGFISRDRIADFLSDTLNANLPCPEHRAPLQTIVRHLRHPDGEMGAPFSTCGTPVLSGPTRHTLRALSPAGTSPR